MSSTPVNNTDLTNTEEVQEYLNNLGIEYRFGCYSEKDPKACQLLESLWKPYLKKHRKLFKCLNQIALSIIMELRVTKLGITK